MATSASHHRERAEVPKSSLLCLWSSLNKLIIFVPRLTESLSDFGSNHCIPKRQCCPFLSRCGWRQIIATTLATAFQPNNKGILAFLPDAIHNIMSCEDFS